MKLGLKTIFFGLATTALASEPDMKGLARRQTPNADNQAPQRPDLGKRSRALYVGASDGKNFAHYQQILASLQSVIKTTTTGVNAIKLREARAVALVNAARAQLIEGDSTKLSALGKNYLEMARNDAQWIENRAAGDREMLGKKEFIVGYADVLENRTKDALGHLVRAVNAVPNASYVPWAELMIAEEYFEAADYPQALKYYKKYALDPNSPHYEIARYKYAWALLNTRQQVAAEASFLSIVLSATSPFRQDTIKDLSFLMTRFRPEAFIVKTAQKIFPDRSAPEYKDFIKTAFVGMENKQTLTNESPLYEVLFALETDPAERVKVNLGLVKGTRRAYAAKQYERAMRNFYRYVDDNKINLTDRSYSSIREEIDGETQVFIRAFVETYTGKVRSPDRYTKTDLAAILQWAFNKYFVHFSSSSIIAEIFPLWNYICTQEKNDLCLVHISAAAAPLKTVPANVREALFWDRIAAIERLAILKPKVWSDRLIVDLHLFEKTFGKSKNWSVAAKRLVDLLIERKDYVTALGIAEKNYLKNPSAETFFSTHWLRFQLGRFEDIVHHRDNSKFMDQHEKTSVIVRESALKLAENAQAKNNFGDFEKYTRMFVGLSKERDKIAVANQALVSGLLSANRLRDAHRYLKNLSEADLVASRLEPQLEEVCVQFLVAGNFAQCEELLQSYPKADTSALEFVRNVLRVGHATLTGVRELVGNPAQARLADSILLLDPAIYTNAFAAQSNLSPTDKAKVFLALGLSAKNEDFKVSESWQAKLGEVLPRRFRDNPPSPTLKTLEKFNRTASPKAPKLETIIASNLEVLKRARKIFVADLKAQLPSMQRTILSSLAEAETSMAALIKGSPVPQGLNAAELAQYQSAVENMASEFDREAQVYAKLLNEVDQGMVEAAQAEQAAAPPPAPRRWSWTRKIGRGDLRGIEKLLKAKAWREAFLLNEILRDRKLIETRDYYHTRAGILISHNPSPNMRRYVFDELKANGHDDVIKDWTTP